MAHRLSWYYLQATASAADPFNLDAAGWQAGWQAGWLASRPASWLARWLAIETHY